MYPFQIATTSLEPRDTCRARKPPPDNSPPSIPSAFFFSPLLPSLPRYHDCSLQVAFHDPSTYSHSHLHSLPHPRTGKWLRRRVKQKHHSQDLSCFLGIFVPTSPSPKTLVKLPAVEFGPSRSLPSRNTKMCSWKVLFCSEHVQRRPTLPRKTVTRSFEQRSPRRVPRIPRH